MKHRPYCFLSAPFSRPPPGWRSSTVQTIERRRCSCYILSDIFHSFVCLCFVNLNIDEDCWCTFSTKLTCLPTQRRLAIDIRLVSAAPFVGDNQWRHQIIPTRPRTSMMIDRFDVLLCSSFINVQITDAQHKDTYRVPSLLYCCL